MSEEQAVAGSEEAESQTTVSEGGAQDESLDDLLKQFEEPEAQAKPEPKQETITKSDLAEIRDYARQSQAAQTEADITSAVDTIHSNLDENVAISKSLLRKMLNGAAGEDVRLRKAWANRRTNPAGYEKVLKGLAREWSKEILPVDKTATETREAVTNAVRGASKPAASEPEDFSKVQHMSDSDFRRWQLEQARKLGF